MRKIRKLCLFLLICLVAGSFITPVLAQPEDQAAAAGGCISLDASNSVAGSEQLLATANAAILYELNSGSMVYSWNPDVMLDPSGMNKIMTALLALENGDPESTVTVTHTALSSLEIGALTAGLLADEEISLRDLLYCMMVGSANDAAAVIAEYIAGSQTTFVEMMNSRANELGCTNTVFLNPSGLSQEGQYSTARDLAKITAAALEREDFCEYFSAEIYTVPATNKSPERQLVTTNFLASKETMSNFFDERVTGGKTGAFTTTDRSLICTAEGNDVRYLSVVMGAQGTRETTLSLFANFKETIALLDLGFGNYALRRLLTTDQVLERFSVTHGENDVAIAAASEIYVMMPKEMEIGKVSYRCIQNSSVIEAPLPSGQPVGTVQVWYDTLCVAQADLVAMHSVGKEGENNLPLSTKAVSTDGGSMKNIFLIISIAVLTVGLILGTVVTLRRSRGSKRQRTRERGERK
jgi:D-alanyl-D-alanine carboxypeptidase (penicillin-binding protein 5/6)